MGAKARSSDDSMLPIFELVMRARAGDEDALEQIVRTYQHRVAAMVISIAGSDDDWQDLCQQIFVKVILGLRRLKDPDTFEPWLFRIARNACFDHLRRRRTRWFLVPWQSWHESIPADKAEDADPRSAALEAAVQQLPSNQRELIGLIRERRWSYSRLAQVTGQSISAVKSNLFRARRRLYQMMKESEAE